MTKEKFVVHTVDGKVISRQFYNSHWGGDQIIAHRLTNDHGLDPFVRNGQPILSVQESLSGVPTFTYRRYR